MRTTILWNQAWLFAPRFVDDAVPDNEFTGITLPHTNQVLPWHNFDDAEYQFISTYRKRFHLPEALKGRRLYIQFDGAMLAATVSINGHEFKEHCGGFTPFEYDITDYIQESGENLLTVHLDSRERADIPPFGYVVDYMTFGGIYRDVYLRYVEPLHLTNVRVKTLDVLTKPMVEIEAFVTNQSDNERAFAINVALMDADGMMLEATSSSSLTVPAHSQSTVMLYLRDLPQVILWSLDDPRLYRVAVQLVDVQYVTQDEIHVQFGFREAYFRADGFYLNGERIQLRGLNRHQNYPYIGCAAPARLQRQDADLIKFDLACNMVRTSHYPQSPHFLQRCDEIGLLVMEEIPGWQHIGDAEWKKLSLRDVRAMIERDWNHPAIVLWGVRINESMDDTEFYTATNQLAHELDNTRQTGGVRYFPTSEFLEDVYTMNDFYGPIEPLQTPWLITEFNGHMFPTKPFDGEERRLEHALRHARYHARAASIGGIAGAIGWCAFDYQTHKEFGSGDRICYHGVSDIFRLPKWAAHFYASQQAPEKKIVLQAATQWSMGDRSEGGNNPLYIFSNCERLEVFIGTDRLGEFFPERDEFPFLPYPPFKLTKNLGMRWGEQYGDLRIVGYWQGEIVAEQQIACDGQPTTLALRADATELQADGADMTRVVFQVLDRYGNVLPYVTKTVVFELIGDAELIGENPFALVGGQAALYVKARHSKGEIVLRAHAPRLPESEITLYIR